MIQASGILFRTDDNNALFLLRGKGSDHPLEWAFPGGQRENDESIEACAIRECLEECGHKVSPDSLQFHTRSIAPAIPHVGACSCGHDPCDCPLDCPCGCNLPSEDVDFTTYCCRIEKKFTPELCDEHIGYAWCTLDNPPEPLHPGVRVALNRIGMDELGVARAMMVGDLTSPQRYENMSLYAMRITGTGASYRPSIDEHVWRPPEEYLNDEFLARCNGLPVIWVHPQKAVLDSKEFAKRIVGTVMLPYIKGDEVWGIVRIYDDDAIASMDEEQLSTSPAVLVGGKRVTTEKGENVLFEDKPTLLDHLAIVPRGVWDKGGDPTGIEMAGMEEKAMADSAENAFDWPSLQSLKANLTLLSIRLSNFNSAQRHR